MAQKLNNAEGGSNGTTVTTGNSGGSSGDAWNAVSVPANSTVTYTTSQFANGSLAYRMTTSGSVTPSFSWSGLSYSNFFLRIYVRAGSFSGGSLVQARDGSSNQIFRLSLNSSGEFVIRNDGNTAQAAGTSSAYSLNTWYRYELNIIPGQNTTYAWRLYTSINGSTAAETGGGTADFGNANIASVFFGIAAATNGVDYYFDGLGISDTTWLGAEITTTDKSGSDTATAADVHTALSVTRSSADTATAADTASAATKTTTETGAAAEAGTLTYSATQADTASVADAQPEEGYAQVEWDEDSVEVRTTIPRLVPGESYTFSGEFRKVGDGPGILVTADDGLSGATVNEEEWVEHSITFIAEKPEVELKFIPVPGGAAVDSGQYLQFRLMSCVAGETGGLADGPDDGDETDWTPPIAIFHGWIESWPARLTASAATTSITVNDRMKKLGETTLASNILEMLYQDDPDLVMPCNDNPEESGGAISITGAWTETAGVAQVTPVATKNGPGTGVVTQAGLVGPTDEDAILLTQATDYQGYSITIPYSKTYLPTPPTPTPVPPTPKTYTKTYHATWSRSFNGSNLTRFDDSAHLYQGDSGEGSNGDQRSLIGFNHWAFYSDLQGAQLLGCSITLYNLHWWYFAGGKAWIGTHGYNVKPATAGTFVRPRRWSSPNWPRYSWRTIELGAAVGVEFQTHQQLGISIGWGGEGLTTYGYFAGATEAQRPYLTITYRK